MTGQRRRAGAVSLSGAGLSQQQLLGPRADERGGKRNANPVLLGLRTLGHVALFLVRLLAQCGPALARPRLIVHQIYNAGARSLIIIMLSGLFVGMVLGLQGFDLLQRFGSEERARCRRGARAC